MLAEQIVDRSSDQTEMHIHVRGHECPACGDLVRADRVHDGENAVTEVAAFPGYTVPVSPAILEQQIIDLKAAVLERDIRIGQFERLVAVLSKHLDELRKLMPVEV